MKAHLSVLTLLAISVTMLMAGGGGSVASAQIPSACTASLSPPQNAVQYSSGSSPLVVSLSASCTSYFGTQLYATANAYDLTSNTGLGTTSTLMQSTNGGTQFNGQLGFNILPTTPTDSIQISASVYASQGGNLITQTSETMPAAAGVQQPVQTVQQTTVTVTEGQYPYANPMANPSTYQPNQPQYYFGGSQVQQQFQGQSHQTHYYAQGYAPTSNNTNLLAYVAIITIIASVIIATAGLALVARRQQSPTWHPWPPPPR